MIFVLLKKETTPLSTQEERGKQTHTSIEVHYYEKTPFSNQEKKRGKT